MIVKRCSDGTYNVDNVIGITLSEVTGVNAETFMNVYKYTSDQVKEIELIISKQDSIHTINQLHAKMLDDLTGNATIEERDTWQSKAIACQNIIEGKETHGQKIMIELEAQSAGIIADNLIKIILDKYESYLKKIGELSGLRTKYKTMINNSLTPDEVRESLIQTEKEFKDYQLSQ